MTPAARLRRVDLRVRPWDRRALAEVRDHVAAGGLIAYPTETVYGFGGGLSSEPLRRLAELKRRGQDDPFLLLVPEGESLDALEGGYLAALRWPDYAKTLARVFWPGALTLVLKDPDLGFPPAVRGKDGGVAVRRSSHPLARAVVDLLGEPVTSTSANPPGGVPARNADGAERAALEVGAGEEMWVLDGGPLEESLPSTVVDCTGDRPVVIRAGAIPPDRIRCAGR